MRVGIINYQLAIGKYLLFERMIIVNLRLEGAFGG